MWGIWAYSFPNPWTTQTKGYNFFERMPIIFFKIKCVCMFPLTISSSHHQAHVTAREKNSSWKSSFSWPLTLFNTSPSDLWPLSRSALTLTPAASSLSEVWITSWCLRGESEESEESDEREELLNWHRNRDYQWTELSSWMGNVFEVMNKKYIWGYTN